MWKDEIRSGMRSNVRPPRGGIPGTAAAALLASSVRSFHQPHCVRWRGSIMCLMSVPPSPPSLSSVCYVQVLLWNWSAWICHCHWLIYRARCTRVASLCRLLTAPRLSSVPSKKIPAGKSSTRRNYFFLLCCLSEMHVNASINSQDSHA